MIYLEVDEPYLPFVLQESLQKAAETTLAQFEHEHPNELSIAIQSDEQLKELNSQYRGIDAPTDVLSFEAGEEDPETGAVYLGDIAISYPRAEEQARAAGHPVNNELQLLVVHGVLHLLGYDHLEPEDKEEMWTLQADILKLLGCDIKQLPEN